MGKLTGTELPLLSENNYTKVNAGQGWRQFDQKINNEAIVNLGKFSSYTERGADWHGENNVKGTDQTFLKSNNYFVKDWKRVRFQIAPNADKWDDENGKPDSVSIVRQQHPEYIFLDIGRWKGTARDFGVVWGRHVYLCSYNPFENDDDIFPKRTYSCSRPGIKYENKNALREGKDRDLFKKFEQNYGKGGNGSINIQAFAWANWGETNDYDWQNIYIIIPDMHLMSVTNGKIWYKYLYPQKFNLDTEFDLLRFTNDLMLIFKDTSLSINKTNVKVIQIGDSYDLWVGCGVGKSGIHDLNNMNDPAIYPLFKENSNEKMVLNKSLPSDSKNVIEFIKGKINDIRYLTSDDLNKCNISDQFYQVLENETYKYCTREELDNRLDKIDRRAVDAWWYLNPAEIAMRKIEQNLPNDGMQYIYGNHDNYLAISEITDAAGLRPRKAFIEKDALFIEHAQRLEFFFEKTNYIDIKEGIDRTSMVLVGGTGLALLLVGGPVTLIIGIISGCIALLSRKFGKKIPVIYPTNEDGAITGFQETNLVYLIERNGEKDLENLGILDSAIEGLKVRGADLQAASHDQPIYREQFAKFWMGRKLQAKKEQKPPSICVIGHTHMPEIYHVKICSEMNRHTMTPDEIRIQEEKKAEAEKLQEISDNWNIIVGDGD
jgi:hypothetical protein